MGQGGSWAWRQTPTHPGTSTHWLGRTDSQGEEGWWVAGQAGWRPHGLGVLGPKLWAGGSVPGSGPNSCPLAVLPCPGRQELSAARRPPFCLD